MNNTKNLGKETEIWSQDNEIAKISKKIPTILMTTSVKSKKIYQSGNQVFKYSDFQRILTKAFSLFLPCHIRI